MSNRVKIFHLKWAGRSSPHQNTIYYNLLTHSLSVFLETVLKVFLFPPESPESFSLRNYISELLKTFFCPLFTEFPLWSEDPQTPARLLMCDKATVIFTRHYYLWLLIWQAGIIVCARGFYVDVLKQHEQKKRNSEGWNKTLWVFYQSETLGALSLTIERTIPSSADLKGFKIMSLELYFKPWSLRCSQVPVEIPCGRNTAQDNNYE